MRPARGREGAKARNDKRSNFAPLRRCAFASAAILVSAAPLSAQSDPRLTAAVRLAQDGLSDSARAVVGRILGSLQATDSLYPEALYTMGFLAGTESDRRLHLRRVVVDYSASEWADDALLQLAQLDYAAGNSESVVRQIDQLLRDYPATPLTATAAFWGARAAGDRRDAETACRMAALGLGTTGADVELRNQLEFQRQRCQGIAATIAESTRNAAATPPRPVRQAPSRPASGFFVQVSAVRTQSAATTEIARVKRAGFDALIVREGGLMKIRVGAFRTRPEADAAAAEIRSKIGARPFVVRVP